jgi:hypothetical protein
MYNIHSHYENIHSFAKTIVAHPRLVYLHPFGSTQPENLESLDNGATGPIIFCYDQEPLLPEFNRELFTKVKNLQQVNYQPTPIILLNTETNSAAKMQLLSEFKFYDCYYFFHAFAAADWYRGYQYCTDLVPPKERKIRKKFITFNRITGSARVYRSYFIAELWKNNLIDQGHVSYSHICPVHGHFERSIVESISLYNVPAYHAIRTKAILNQIKEPLRIDFKDSEFIENSSQVLSAIPEMMESFLHVVTETCFWESKCHLTEKIFKPIVARQPFVLLGCAGNLKYLRKYGFKTFDAFWNEEYDTIQDPLERMQAVVRLINQICSLSTKELERMLRDMNEVLEYNYQWFYSKKFIDLVWNEFSTNLEAAVVQLPRRI